MMKTNAREFHSAQLQRAHDLGQSGQIAAAEHLYREYLKEAPQDAQVLFNVGVLIQQRASSPSERYEAAGFYEKALQSPEADMELKASCLNNMGILMMKVDRPDKAKIAFGFALQIDPLHTEARVNFAECLRFECNYEEADKQFETILQLDHDNASAHFNRGMIAIMFGDLKRGFEHYEHRFDVAAFPTKRFDSAKPLWKGEPLDGKTIVFTAEQGFGDAIQFIRYAQEVKDRWPTCRVWAHTHTLLVNLFKGARGLDLAFDRSDAEDYDYHVPIMSLPHRLGTELATIPARVPYIEPHDDWTPYYLPRPDSRPRIGIVWAGSPRHGKDAWRSLKPEQVQPIIDGVNANFYSLQVGPRWEEVNRINGIISLAPDLLGWEYTAQAILQLDLVITVDTAVAHLAGALGKPVWMMCPYSPDFRWMLGRDDSPWYPTMKIFRQPSKDDWTSVINRIVTELNQWNA